MVVSKFGTSLTSPPWNVGTPEKVSPGFPAAYIDGVTILHFWSFVVSAARPTRNRDAAETGVLRRSTHLSYPSYSASSSAVLRLIMRDARYREVRGTRFEKKAESPHRGG